MKVLIVSHVPTMTRNNMGKTFLSLFSAFDRQELCQLYIYPTLPDVDRCASFYRVTDKEALRAVLRRNRIGGEVAPDTRRDREVYEVARDEALYRNRKNKSTLRRLFRDAIWVAAPWYNKNLEQWLEREKPDCIFLSPGPARFIYNIALKISKKRNIPIITYFCDEYYFVKKGQTLLERLRLKLLHRKIEAVMARSPALVVICDALQREYSRHFGVNAVTLMTGATLSAAAAHPPREVSSLCYFGNIRCNRYLSLAAVGKALDRLNGRLGTEYRLDIYSAEKDPVILSAFDGIASVKLHGFVTGEAYDRAFRQAGLLLHVEAFDEASIDFVCHSVSTKIADSLASGIPLVAYGPDCVASMEHLMKNNCAITATAEAELEKMLQTAFTDEAMRTAVVENALETAKRCHDSDENSRRLHKLCLEVLK